MVTADRKIPGMAVTDRKPVREQAVRSWLHDPLE
jgi:hypothetical protein